MNRKKIAVALIIAGIICLLFAYYAYYKFEERIILYHIPGSKIQPGTRYESGYPYRAYAIYFIIAAEIMFFFALYSAYPLLKHHRNPNRHGLAV